MNSCEVVEAEDRKVWNSSRKMLMGWEYFDDDGGRQMLKTVSVEEGSLSVTDEHKIRKLCSYKMG